MTSFDPSKFTVPEAKPLPVILLLDVSGSMSGEKIRNLNEAVQDMLETFRDQESGEIEIHVAIITFGAEVRLHQKLSRAGDVRWQDLTARGMTPLGAALRMAKAMIEDKGVIPSRAYRPTVVLVSDGQPNDDWEKPLVDFVSHGRSSKCDRMAMAIGADADEGVLGKFIEGTTYPLFYAENAKQLRDFFRFVTMSVTSRTRSQTPNVTPDLSVMDVKPATIESRTERPRSSTKSHSDGTEKNEEACNEGYW
ncbi:vWA domain-containing protein [Thermopirellula anaerolimosa]